MLLQLIREMHGLLDAGFVDFRFLAGRWYMFRFLSFVDYEVSVVPRYCPHNSYLVLARGEFGIGRHNILASVFFSYFQRVVKGVYARQSQAFISIFGIHHIYIFP